MMAGTLLKALLRRESVSWACAVYFSILLCPFGSPPSIAQEGSSVWKNTRPGVRYVGSAECVDCHREQHASFLETAHSESAAKTIPDQEPPSATYTQALTGFRYEIDRIDGKLIHREVMRDLSGDPIAEATRAMTLTIGSGTHAKSYLYEMGDFLGQSPITWYRETESWDMSPGFDKARHFSFRRTIGTGCVFCHVGVIDRQDYNPYRFEIVETTIGCERCHGPGELHVKRHRSEAPSPGPNDDIVNPARLERNLAEAICQQCHLQGAGKAPVTDRDQWDYRPGLPLTDFHIDYQYRFKDEPMRIVGHVEQMHASECYKQTETLTCTTCHHPHQPVDDVERIDFHRSACLKCHEDQSCGEPLEKRVELTGNSCFECHMPRSKTNVTHAALHHHRIGIHDQDADLQEADESGLNPILDISSLPQRERDRCLALAKIGFIRNESQRPERKQFEIEATRTLIELMNTGNLDPLAVSQMAWLARTQGERAIAEQLASDVLKVEKRPTMARIEATEVLAEIALEKQNTRQAADLFQQANGYYRNSRNAFYLGIALNNLGEVDKAITTLEDLLEFDPSQTSAHAALRAIYQVRNQPEKAAYHEQMFLKLSALFQVLDNR